MTTNIIIEIAVQVLIGCCVLYILAIFIIGPFQWQHIQQKYEEHGFNPKTRIRVHELADGTSRYYPEFYEPGLLGGWKGLRVIEHDGFIIIQERSLDYSERFDSELGARKMLNLFIERKNNEYAELKNKEVKRKYII